MMEELEELPNNYRERIIDKLDEIIEGDRKDILSEKYAEEAKTRLMDPDNKEDLLHAQKDINWLIKESRQKEYRELGKGSKELLHRLLNSIELEYEFD